MKRILLSTLLTLGGLAAMAQAPYKYVCTDYVSTDNNRAPQSAFKYDKEANTISITGRRGTHNIAFQTKTSIGDDTYVIDNDQTWFVVVGKNLSAQTEDSHIWWFNGANKSGQVAANYAGELDGQTFVAWDIKNTPSLTVNMDYSQQWLPIGSFGANFINAVGLTPKTGSQATISYIGYLSVYEAVAMYPQAMEYLQFTPSSLTSTIKQKTTSLIASSREESKKIKGSYADKLKAQMNDFEQRNNRLSSTDYKGAMQLLGEVKKEVCRAQEVASANFETQVIQYGPNIVRVLKGGEHKSYSVIRKAEKCNNPNFKWTVDAEGNVTFTDLQGRVLLSEKSQRTTPITTGVDKGKYKVAQSWTLEPDEAIFGLGQRREQVMNQRGQSFRLWNTNTHIYIPYFTSEKGYGLYWDNAGETFFEDNQNSDDADAYGTTFRSSVATGVDYYFIYRDGTQDGVMAGIRELSGQATMFPLWTMGFWQCRERYKTPDELTSVIDEYRQRQIPLDGIVQDWQYWGCDSNWNSMKFENPHYLNKIGDAAQMRYLPNDENAEREIAKFKAQGKARFETPQQMIDYAHEQNTHLMITIWPDFGPWTDQYAELKKMNALYPFNTWPQNRGVLVYDAFNPKARDLYWRYLTNLYKMGIDAWWTDSTEPDHFEKRDDSDFLTADGSWRSVKNAFSLVTNRGIYEHQRKQNNLWGKSGDADKLIYGPGKRSFQMTRSGAFGIQHYGTFSWSGDILSTWNEMKNQIPSGLNYSLCGIPMWNTDLGGFFCGDLYGNNPKNPIGQEINVRWMQWGTFMPLMRSHCSSPMVSEIYKYGDKGDWAYDCMVDAVKLRYRLLPYIYSTLGACTQRDEVMMRALVMDFPKDKKAINLDNEYMFGRALLVKPVTDPMFTWTDDNRQAQLTYPDPRQAQLPTEVYLPEGAKWYDFWTSQPQEGGRTVRKAVSINEIPVYVRAGSILPWGPEVQYSDQKKWDDMEVRIYPGADGQFILYEDEGDGYGYEKGQFSEITFQWNDQQQKLTIAPRKGQYKGMIGERTFRVVLMKAGMNGNQEHNSEAISIRYTGQKVEKSL